MNIQSLHASAHQHNFTTLAFFNLYHTNDFMSKCQAQVILNDITSTQEQQLGYQLNASIFISKFIMNCNMFKWHIFPMFKILENDLYESPTYRQITSDSRYIFTLWLWQVFKVVDNLLKNSFQASIYIKSHHSRGSQ